MNLHVVLVHHPVLARDGSLIASTITNLDVHDIARSARTYGAASYVLIHPVEAQRQLVERILGHWEGGHGATRIPTRKDALAIVTQAPSLADAYAPYGGRSAVEVWVTGARPRQGKPSTDYPEARARLDAAEAAGKAVFLLFGTSWGLAPEILDDADVYLASIAAKIDAGFNHLSVRAAAAITLDRLRG